MTVPTALIQAHQQGRLLVLWGALPFHLEEEEPANPAQTLNRLLSSPAGTDATQARTLAALPGLPPLPILSLDASRRLEGTFDEAGVPYKVVASRRDVPSRARHSLLKLAGDLQSRTAILSRDEVHDVHPDGGNVSGYLLAEARRAAAGGAVLLLGCDPADPDFRAWWTVLTLSLQVAALYALGEPSAPWPEGVTCLKTGLEALSAALWAARPAAILEPEPAATQRVAPAIHEGTEQEERRRDVHTFEITINPTSGEGWPVVGRYRGPGHLQGVRGEGTLHLDLHELRAQPSPLDYGRILGQALFRGDLFGDFRWALGKSDDDLHVLLSLEAGDLRTLRWERLCAQVDDEWDHLALDQRTPFSLALPSYSSRRFPPLERSDLRALLLVASPEGLDRFGLDAFDTEEALAIVSSALDKIRVPHETLATLPGGRELPTVDRIVQRLTRGGCTLLHLVCHGRTRRDGETALFLADEDGQVDLVKTTDLIGRLRRLRSAGSLPYLAFLATCQSASPEAEGALGGLAHRLVRDVGIPAVLAMTDRVTVQTAQDLARRFYGRLWAHGEPDRALVEATAPLAGRPDITVPALYSRLGGQPLFQVRSGATLPRQRGDAGQGVTVPDQDETAQPTAAPGSQQLLASLRIDAENPPYAALRALLLQAFTPDDLRRFCQERSSFRPVLDNIGSGASANEIIDALFEFCRTRLRWDELLAELVQIRPEQVTKFADRLRPAGSK